MSLGLRVAGLTLLAAVWLALVLWAARWPRRDQLREVARASLLAAPLVLLLCMLLWLTTVEVSRDGPAWGGAFPGWSVVAAGLFLPGVLLFMRRRPPGPPDLGAWVASLAPAGRACLEAAAGLVHEAQHVELTPAHLVLAALRGDPALQAVLERAGEDPQQVTQEAEARLQALPSGHPSAALSPDLLALLERVSRERPQTVGPARLLEVLLVEAPELWTPPPPGSGLKGQVARLAAPARAGLELAAGLCVDAGHAEVGLAHLVLGVVRTDARLREALEQAGVDPEQVVAEAEARPQRAALGVGKPVFSQDLCALFELATRGHADAVDGERLLRTLLTPPLRERALEVSEALAAWKDPA